MKKRLYFSDCLFLDACKIMILGLSLRILKEVFSLIHVWSNLVDIGQKNYGSNNFLKDVGYLCSFITKEIFF